MPRNNHITAGGRTERALPSVATRDPNARLPFGAFAPRWTLHSVMNDTGVARDGSRRGRGGRVRKTKGSASAAEPLHAALYFPGPALAGMDVFRPLAASSVYE
jgi:hypothetical protein